MKSYAGIYTVAGSHKRVEELLRNAGFDAFTVFGEFDVICRNIEFSDVSECRRTIDRMISVCDKLINRTHTLVLVNPSPKLSERPPFAFVLVSVSSQIYPQALEQIRMQDGILSAELLFGPYDIMCEVEAENLAQLENVVTNILRTPGVLSSLTMIRVPRPTQ